MSTDTARWEWGPAAVGTLLVLAAITVGAGAGVALFWVSSFDPASLAHTLTTTAVIGAIVADLAWMTRTGRALHRAYRRRP